MILSSLVLQILLVSVPSASAYSVLIIGGTRFSGAALWKELHDRGHDVTVYNRGKTPPAPVAGYESDSDFDKRIGSATFLKGGRKDPAQLESLIEAGKYDFVYDMNARERSDVEPLAKIFASSDRLQQYVFMSSAGVYLKSFEMPHQETDAIDPNCRHRGKLESEACLKEVLGTKWCSFRPTYICGPGNYNPVERYFFARVAAGRPVCVPGHGQHLTGLGHVRDLATAMANVVDRADVCAGQIYNVQNVQAVTFDGVAKIAGKVVHGSDYDTEIVHYDPKDIKFLDDAPKAFPMRPQHFFTDVQKVMKDLDWKPEFDTTEKILRDAYEHDFKLIEKDLKTDFICDDIVTSGAPQPVVG